MDILVTNLSEDVTERYLEKRFSKYGKVVSVRIRKSRAKKYKYRRYASIEMATEGEAEMAIVHLNGASMDGRDVKIRLASTKRNREWFERVILPKSFLEEN